MRNLYTILGIGKDADQASIRKAYKSLARQYHPDLNKAPEAAERFKEVNTAHEVLSDEQRRNLYDTFGDASLKQGFNPDAARQWRQATGGSGRGGFGGFGGFGGGGGIDIEDLLNSFSSRTRAQAPRRPAAPAKGADIEQPLVCTLAELIAREKKVVTIRRPSACEGCKGSGGSGKHRCPACAGSGHAQVGTVTFPCVACGGNGVRFKDECSTCESTGRIMSEERIKVGIPLGVSHGQTIRIRGKGAEGPRGGKPGDLLLAIAIEAHERFQRDGSHLRLAVPLTIHEAMTGAKIEIPTLDGRIRVTIPPNATPGTTMRIKGKGLPRSKDKRGDLFLELQPTPPSSDAPEASDVAMQLDAFYTESPRADWDDQ